MTEKRIRPRSLELYTDDVKDAARRLFMESFFIKDEPKYKSIRDDIMSGGFDEYEPVKMAAFIVNKLKSSPAGVSCLGCGSSWDDERLSEEKAKRPELRSCCPERKIVPVYRCDFA